MLKRLLLAAAFFAMSAAVPFAQPFNPLATVSLSVTSSSARVALPTGGGTSAKVCNTGSNTAFVKFGDSTVTSSATDNTASVTPVVAGACEALSPNGGTNIAAITSSSTTTLSISTGNGLPSGFGGGSGGGTSGGNVVIVDGTTPTSKAPVSAGALSVAVQNANANLATNADAIAAVAANAAGAGSPVNSSDYVWNGSTWDRMPGSTVGVKVVPQVATTGGMTTFFVQPAASDNHTVVKAGAGQVYGVFVFNNSATVNYLRLYNATTGFNGCNSATNLVTQIQIPASTSVGGYSLPLPFPIPFSTGISICVTSGYATTDTTNATASAMSLTIGYN